MKVVLNLSETGFDVSTRTYEYLINECGWKVTTLPEQDADFDKVDAQIFIISEDEYDFVETNLNSIKFRSNPDLVRAVETLGTNAWTEAGAKPAVKTICDNNVKESPMILIVQSDMREYVARIEDLLGK